MPTTVTCPSCRHENRPEDRFCLACGRPLAASQLCKGCGAPLAPGAVFCTNCGARVQESEVPQGPGMVAGGVWDKGDGELVRRVTLREMGGRYDRALRDQGLADAAGDGFWGFLLQAGRQALEQLQTLTLQVPMGCVAAVMLDGQVTEILPPGRQTTLGFLRDVMQSVRAVDDSSQSLWQRAVGAFKSGGGAMVEQVLDRAFSDRLQRTGFYLVDRRPIPVHFQHLVPGLTEGHTVTLGVTVSAHLVGGSDQAAKDGLTTFIQRLVADRESLDAQVVHQRLLPHVERLVKDGARRFRTEQGLDLARLEAFIREQLAADFGHEHGLRFDVLAAPRDTVAGLDLHLGQAPTPDLRACANPDCGAEIGVGQRFCTRCGQEQPTRVEPDRRCAACGEAVPLGSAFCTACGQPFTGGDPTQKPLVSADSQMVEIDLVLRVQGDRELSDPRRIVEAVADAAARLVRGMSYAELASAEGFRRLEEGLREVAVQAVRTLDLRLIDLTVLDCKSRNGEWTTHARAEIERARSELTVGREWLAIEGERVDVEALTLELVLRREQVQRDTDFARLQAELDQARGLDEARLRDREARRDLQDRAAAEDVTDAQRDTQRAIGQDQAARERDRHLRGEDHADAVTGQEQAAVLEDLSDAQRRKRETGELGHQIGLEEQTAVHEDVQARRALELGSDRTRVSADDEDYSEGKRQVRAERAAQHAHGLEMDELRVAAELQRQRMEAEAEAERARLEAVKGMDTAQVLAAAAHGRPLTDAEASALAQAASAGNTQALAAMERLMAEKDANKVQMVEILQRMGAQALDQKNKDSDRMAALFEQATAAMAGAQQQQRQTIAAHQAAADAARSMAERSMESQARVAAAAAQGPQQVVHMGTGPLPGRGRGAGPAPGDEPPATPTTTMSCVGCGVELPPGATFCGTCGTRQG
ncbi:MAG: zinc-ribbon domain-containing protein [Pseudomonadota bacterium]